MMYLLNMELNKYIIELTYFLKVKLDLDNLPKIKLNNDKEVTNSILCPTAWYDFVNNEIVIFTFNRHPKDILRSHAHEMIHYKQNEQGRLGNVTTTDITKDSDLIKLEEEAYLLGNMLFREFTTLIDNGKIKF